MISSAIIPQPLARLPWRLIFLVAGIAGIGIITLYSAAGGSAQPWATKQAIVILFFLAIAITMSWSSEATIKKVAFPLYGAAHGFGVTLPAPTAGPHQVCVYAIAQTPGAVNPRLGCLSAG